MPSSTPTMFKRFWPCLLIIPPVTLVGGVLVAAVITYLMPTRYESFAVIEIQHLPARPVDFSTEMGKLTSPAILGRASERLDLTTRWGTDSRTSIARLRDSLHIEQIRESDLLRIRARHAHREDARDIALAVVQAYQAHRTEILDAEKAKRLEELRAAIAEQEQKVVELRAQKMTEGDAFPHAGGEPTSELAARHDLETDVLMKMKVDVATLDHSSHGFIDPSLILVHDAPLIAEAPYSPKVGLNFTLGAGSGLLLGFPMALAIMVILQRRSRGS